MLCVLLLSMGVVAGFAVLASMLPRLVAWPLAVISVVQGFGLASREWRSPRVDVHIGAGSEPALIDGGRVETLKLDWRGPIAVLAWRGHTRRWHRRVWMPGHLPPAARRELRLAVSDFHASRTQRSMAP